MDVENAMLVVQLTDGVSGGKALEVLHIVAYFASEDIDTSMFLELLGGTEETTNAVELLKRHSLVQSGDEESKIRIEKDVQEKVQKLLKEQEKEEAVLKAAIGLLSKFLSPDSLNHAVSVFNAMKAYPELVKEHNSFPVDIIQHSRKVNKETSNFGREALNVLTEFVGKYHPSSIAVQKSLGLALLCTEKPDEALELLIEVYEKISQVEGEKEISQTLHLIAKIMSSFTSEPESRLRQLVFGDMPISDTNNNSILNQWCQYALMLNDFKWIDEAMPILVQVHEKRRQLLNPDDDDICEVEDTIAHLHLKQKDYQISLEVFRKVYEERKTKLGEHCIKTTYSRRGIADSYESLDMLDEALNEYEAVSEKLRQVFGEDDTRYLDVLGKIAHILYRQKEHDKSCDLYTRIYDKYVVEKGEMDIQTLNIKRDLGNVLLVQGKTQEALCILGEVVQGYFCVLGPDHPECVKLLEKILPFMMQSNLECNEKLQNVIDEGNGGTLTFEVELHKGLMREVNAKGLTEDK